MPGYSGASWRLANFEQLPLDSFYPRKFAGEPIGAHFSGMGKMGSWVDDLEQLAAAGASIYKSVTQDGKTTYQAYNQQGKLIASIGPDQTSNMLLIGGAVLLAIFLLKK